MKKIKEKVSLIISKLSELVQNFNLEKGINDQRMIRVHQAKRVSQNPKEDCFMDVIEQKNNWRTLN